MQYTYVPQGVCSRMIQIEAESGIIKKVVFSQGCHGNLQGISRLVEGQRPQEVISKLDGIQCRMGTSCPDQLAKALRKMMEQQEWKDQDEVAAG